MESLRKRLEQREREGALRTLPLVGNLIDFSSNDYLGFASDATIQAAISNYVKSLSANHGSTGSRLISGNSELVEELEKSIARFHSSEAALLFNSGYDANLGLLSSVTKRGDTILYDQFSHASIRDGIRLSFAKSYSFKHNDLDDLKKKAELARGDIWVMVESLYSMDGDMAPLKEIADLCYERGYKLIVDEAHALGVFGQRGEGLINNQDIISRVFARVVTFGKALGCHGAVVLGSGELRRYLINFAHSFIYSTALPKSSLAAIKVGYDYLPKVLERREKLQFNINLFLQNFKRKDLLIPSDSQIQALVLSGNRDIVELSTKLKEMGLSLHAIRAPTVPKGKERLRISLHSFNNESELEKLLEALHHLLS